MENRVHGHRVLEHLIAHQSPLPLSALREWANASFGSVASYHTCSQDGMTFDGLIEFLITRNKISVVDGQVSIGASRMCQDGDSHEHGHDHPHDHAHGHSH